MPPIHYSGVLNSTRTQLQNYKSIVGTDKLGGHEFNLSKWPKAELQSHSLDNVCDPSSCHRLLVNFIDDVVGV